MFYLFVCLCTIYMYLYTVFTYVFVVIAICTLYEGLLMFIYEPNKKTCSFFCFLFL